MACAPKYFSMVTLVANKFICGLQLITVETIYSELFSEIAP